MTPPPLPLPSAAVKVMEPASTGWLLNVTVPLTSPWVSAAQPASTSSARAQPARPANCMRMANVSSAGASLPVGAGDVLAARGTQRLPGGQLDAVGDELDAAVAEQDVDAARVPAARGVELGAGRGRRHAQAGVRVGADPVDHVRRAGVGGGEHHEAEGAVVVHEVAAPVVVVVARR